MKRIVSLVLALVLAAGSLAGCVFGKETAADPADFLYNTCPEVQLTDGNEDNIYANVKALSDGLELGSRDVLAAYRISGYEGKITLDLQGKLPSGDTDVAVYLFSGTEQHKVSCARDGSQITLHKKLSADRSYELYVVEADFWQDTSMRFGSLSRPAPKQPVTGQGMVFCSPLLCELLKRPVNVIYEKLADQEDTEIVRQQVMDSVYTFFNEDGEEIDQHLSDDHIKSRYGVILNLQYKILSGILPVFELPADEGKSFKWYHALFVYYFYDKPAQEETASQPTESVDGFSTEKDTLPFGNFSTADTPEGNCPGISYLTAKLYNTGSFPSKGDGWDLTTDPANATLMDKGLSDYKTADFVLTHSTDGQTLNKDLTAGETQFVNMIVSCSDLGNEKIQDIHSKNTQYGFQTRKYSLINGMLKELNEGKILMLYMKMNGKNEYHVVNVYDYAKDPVDADVLWLYVYDSNYPGNDVGGESLSDFGFRIRVVRATSKQNTEIFHFDYAPISGSDYGATSNLPTGDRPLFLPITDNWTLAESQETPSGTEDSECAHLTYQVLVDEAAPSVALVCQKCKKGMNPSDFTLYQFARYKWSTIADSRTDEEIWNDLEDFMQKETEIQYVLWRGSNAAAATVQALEMLSGEDVTEEERNMLVVGLKELKFVYDLYRWIYGDSDEFQWIHADIDVPKKLQQVNTVIDAGTRTEQIVGGVRIAANLYTMYKNGEADKDKEVTDFERIEMTQQYLNTYIDCIDTATAICSDPMVAKWYGLQWQGLRKVTNDYFKSAKKYVAYHEMYDDVIDGPMRAVFRLQTDGLDEFSTLLYGLESNQVSKYWTESHMPSVSVVMTRLQQVDMNSLSVHSVELINKYLEFRLHYEFEQYTGVTLECYTDLATSKKLPWKSDIDIHSYESFTIRAK